MKRYYLIGISGIAMASVAGLLKARGYEVAGSDQKTWPPASTLLENLKIKVFSPFSVENIKKYKPDVVVVGNAVGRNNPEVEYLLNQNIPYYSIATILKEEFIRGKKAIVITGTHGKTTTTSLVAWILEVAGLDPSLFVGGIAKNFNSSFKLGQGQYIVLEGDEYDTAFFDKGPKFWHYRPYVALVNNIELDHVDIYKDLEAIKFSFDRLIKLIPSQGLLVINQEDKNIQAVMNQNKDLPVTTTTFGLKNGDYTASGLEFKNDVMVFDIFEKGKLLTTVSTGLVGSHNVTNILSAIAISRFLKIPLKKIIEGIATFKGVKRRMEIIGVKNQVTVIDDYAHHPTAVFKTLQALTTKFPKARLLVIFEPGSASSKRRIFENDYIKSFKQADVIYIYKPYNPINIQAKEKFSNQTVAKALKTAGWPAFAFDDMDLLLKNLKTSVQPNDVIIIMSCRGFDGIFAKIMEIL